MNASNFSLILLKKRQYQQNSTTDNRNLTVGTLFGTLNNSIKYYKFDIVCDTSGRKIAPNTGASATKIFTLATKS